MKIEIKDCNNIKNGIVSFTEGRLNIKYGNNGVGKSTISKTINTFLNNDENMIEELRSYDNDNSTPYLSGIDNVKSISIYDEQFVEQYVLLQEGNELVKNSFEIFIKTKDYDEKINEIENLLTEVKKMFETHLELQELMNGLQQFIDDFGKNKSGYSPAGVLGKTLGLGNKISNIPKSLDEYSTFIKSSNNTDWLKWQSEGLSFVDDTNKCPFCLSNIKEKRGVIEELNEIYKSKDIKKLTEVLNMFDIIKPYFENETNTKVSEIEHNSTGMKQEQINYLIEIKNQAENLLNAFVKLLNLNFNSLKNVDNISDLINSYKIDIALYNHLNSDLMVSIINDFNSALDTVISKASELQSRIASQKNKTKNVIENYKTDINNFLSFAGYKYQVDFIDDFNTSKLILTYKNATDYNRITTNNLSYGERNALALVMFLYCAIKENPDLIILDDPVSSFDDNKKYAIMNMLFHGKDNLQNKSVLLLTHDFNIIIDIMYNFHHSINPSPVASFLCNKNGELTEKEIKKENIKSIIDIKNEIISSNSIDNINKLIYLRRCLELDDENKCAYELVSNLFHKREKPIVKNVSEMGKEMTSQEIEKGISIIKGNGIDFDYQKELNKVLDFNTMLNLYNRSSSNYEKLQIFRIMYDGEIDDAVFKKYLDETYHIENDFLFQLNPTEYETIPQYIVDICDNYIKEHKK